jgi:hypothetical protein
MSALAQAQHHSLIRCTSLRLPFTMPAALLAYPAAHRCTPSLRPGSLPLAAGRRMLCLQPGAALQQRLHFLKQAPLDCGGSLGRHVQTCKTGMHAKAAPRAPCASRLSAAASSCTHTPSLAAPLSCEMRPANIMRTMPVKRTLESLRLGRSAAGQPVSERVYIKAAISCDGGYESAARTPRDFRPGCLVRQQGSCRRLRGCGRGKTSLLLSALGSLAALLWT